MEKFVFLFIFINFCMKIVIDSDSETDDDFFSLPTNTKPPLAPSLSTINQEREQNIQNELNDKLQSLKSQLTEVEKEINKLNRKRGQISRQIEQTQLQIDGSARTIHLQKNEQLKVGYESSSAFPWSKKVHGLLRNVFGIESFRGNQEAVINATLDGRDVVVIMPTGGGKSLCYQLPALVSNGLTLVISPLIALMDDQVLQLKDTNIDAEAFTSESADPTAIKAKIRALTKPIKNGKSQPRRSSNVVVYDDEEELSIIENDSVLEDIPDGLRLLYASPEKVVASKQFLSLIEKVHAAGNLARIVIDECHCASEYGNDFRPDYKKLGNLKYLFPTVPLIALSATCPPRVLESVQSILGIEGNVERPSALVYTSPLWRPNLRYSVETKVENAVNQRLQVVKWITEHHGSDRGIVYCATKNDAYELATVLFENDIRSYRTGLYYGNLERSEKEKLHRMWRNNQVQIIVATNAFGMGINSLDVRFVVHFTAPKTLENYYQESGRAGRDGKPADCVLFYRSPDSSKLVGWGFDGQSLEGLAKARAMVSYAECQHICRKVILESYLQNTPTSSVPVSAVNKGGGGGKGKGKGKEKKRKRKALVAGQYDQGSQFTLLTSDETGIDPCNVCDVCRRNPQTISVDCTSLLVTVVNIVLAAGSENLTLSKLVAYCRGNGMREKPPIAQLSASKQARFLPKMSPDQWGYIVNTLTDRGVLVERFSHSGYVTNAYLGIASQYMYMTGSTIDGTSQLDTDPFVIDFADDEFPAALKELNLPSFDTGEDED